MRNLFLLPGFLGRPEDFKDLQKELKSKSEKTQVFDWLNAGEDLLSQPLISVGDLLFEKLKALGLQDNDRVLGYSLGGRLALSLRETAARQNFPLEFIFVSTNPGLMMTDEKIQRRLADDKWADRFLSEDWLEVMTAWNAQGVFQNSKKEPLRRESDYQRSDLARILTKWSLAEQPDYRESLKKQPQNFLWLTGSLDSKFKNLAKGLPRHHDVPGASHRVHLDAPAELARLLTGAAV